MAKETKRRLVCSKWEIARETERAWQDQFDQQADQIDSLEAALLDVKYWMHDALVLHLPMRDPRVILRKVEDVLG